MLRFNAPTDAFEFTTQTADFWMDVTLKGTCLAVGAWAVTALLRKYPAGARRACWAAALGAMVIVPFAGTVTPQTPIGPWPPIVPRAAVVEAPAPPAAAPATATALFPSTLDFNGLPTMRPSPLPGVRMEPLAAPAPLASAPAFVTPTIPRPEAVVPEAAKKADPRYADMIAMGALLLWFGGAAAGIGRIVLGQALVQHRIRRAKPAEGARIWQALDRACSAIGLRRRPDVRLDERTQVPFVGGLFRGTIVLPAEAKDWDDERLEQVLLHECGHLRRADLLLLMLGQLAVALHWFNPLAHLALRRLRLECEKACDEGVISTGRRATDYARLLIEFASRQVMGPVRAAALPMAARTELKDRLETMLTTGPRRSVGAFSKWGSVIVACLAVIALSSVRVDVFAEEPAAPRPAAPGESAPAKADPFLDLFFYRSAMTANQNANWQESYDGFVQAYDLGYQKGLSAYNAACALARLGRTDEAFDWLIKAADDGLVIADHAEEDKDLASLREDRRWAGVLAAFRANEDRASAWAPTAFMNKVGAAVMTGTFGDAATVTADADEEARRAKVRADWERFVQVNQPVYDANQDETQVLFDLSYARIMLGDYRTAAEGFATVYERNVSRGLAAYNAACSHAQLGEKELALEWLRKAAAEGAVAPDGIEEDFDLRSLRGDAEFAKVIEEARKEVERRSRWIAPWAPQPSRAEVQPKAPAAPSAPAAPMEKVLSFWDTKGAKNGQDFSKAYSDHYAKDYDASIPAFQRLYEAGYQKQFSAYNVACGYALQGDADEAFEWLEKAMAEGLDPQVAAEDSDMDPLRKDPRFRKIVEQVAD